MGTSKPPIQPAAAPTAALIALDCASQLDGVRMRQPARSIAATAMPAQHVGRIAARANYAHRPVCVRARIGRPAHTPRGVVTRVCRRGLTAASRVALWRRRQQCTHEVLQHRHSHDMHRNVYRRCGAPLPRKLCAWHGTAYIMCQPPSPQSSAQGRHACPRAP